MGTLNWALELARTYDKNTNIVGKQINESVLIPVFHIVKDADIEVKIDINGNFKAANFILQGYEKTIMPVTVESYYDPTSGLPKIKALCGELYYIAGDYIKYTDATVVQKIEYAKAHRTYLQNLGNWANKNNTHLFVKAIHEYTSKKTLCKDLIASKVVRSEFTEEKGNKVEYIDDLKVSNTVIRFIVLGGDDESTNERRTWKNIYLFENYIEYYRDKMCSDEKSCGTCCVYGDKQYIVESYPPLIGFDSIAKLISGSEYSNVNGRFGSKNSKDIISKSVSMGFETSCKIHNILRWLNDTWQYVEFRDKANEEFKSRLYFWVPGDLSVNISNIIDSDSIDLGYNDIAEYNNYANIDNKETDDIIDALFNSDDWGILDTDKDSSVITAVKDSVRGYSDKVKIRNILDKDINILSIDKLLKGRCAVTYFDNIRSSEFIESLKYWYNHCLWEQNKTLSKGNTIKVEYTPSLKQIIETIYGEQITNNGDVYSSNIKIILKCMLYRKSIPGNLIKTAVDRVSQPQAFKDGLEWYSSSLKTVCAIIRYNYEIGGKGMGTFFDDNKDNRDVLFGRLLAVYDLMEERAMYGRDERITNARRYWYAYRKNPSKTSELINTRLISGGYINKLSIRDREYFENLRNEINAKLADTSGVSNKPLGELYLPAYCKQMDEMKKTLR